MPNPYFRFKQFTVNQERCAMKVGTDGVVLGVTADFNGCSRLVDVGSGTGVVALIIKQRFPDADVTAVEIDPDAAAQAQENFDASPWKIECVCDSWQKFASAQAAQGVRFDGIFCNPPYFTASLKAPSAARTLARHNDSLPFSELLQGVGKVLKQGGRFYIIIPSTDFETIINEAAVNNLFLQSMTYIHPVEGGAHKRVVLCLSNVASGKAEERHLYIETIQRKVYTEEFKKLTEDFYL